MTNGGEIEINVVQDPFHNKLPSVPPSPKHNHVTKDDESEDSFDKMQQEWLVDEINGTTTAQTIQM